MKKIITATFAALALLPSLASAEIVTDIDRVNQTSDGQNIALSLDVSDWKPGTSAQLFFNVQGEYGGMGSTKYVNNQNQATIYFEGDNMGLTNGSAWERWFGGTSLSVRGKKGTYTVSESRMATYADDGVFNINVDLRYSMDVRAGILRAGTFSVPADVQPYAQVRIEYTKASDVNASAIGSLAFSSFALMGLGAIRRKNIKRN